MESNSGTVRKTNIRFLMLSLLFVNIMINYLDRANLSVASQQIGTDFGLDSAQMGRILGAFGLTYALLQIPGGLLADRVAPRLLYAICLITWSIATVFQGFARGFLSLFSARLATGALEAPSYPINNRIVTSWFPNSERAAAIAIYVSGQFIGLAFFSPVLRHLQASYGWQGMFVITGVIGIVWGVIWFTFYRDPLDHPKANEAELGYIEQGGGLLTGKGPQAKAATPWSWKNLGIVLSHKTLWGVYIAQFCVNATLWFFLTWFPTYLVQYRGFDFIKSGYYASIPFLAACAGLLLSGFLSDRAVRKGKPVAIARKVPIILGLLISVSLVGANYTDSRGMVIFFMSLSFFGAGMALISWVFVSILSPQNLIGLTGGVFNFMGNLASIVVPIVIGELAKGGNFAPALVFIASLGLIGALSYIFLVTNAERIKV